MNGEQSNWSKLTLGEDEEVEPSLKAKVYNRVLFSLVEMQ
jgi:hypothetical protein